jgi:hypothetical protein
MLGIPSVFSLKAAGIVGAIALAAGSAGGFGLAWKLRTGELEKWKLAAHDYRVASRTWEGHFHKSEGLRSEEARQANNALSQEQDACDARVASAQASAKVIRKIISRPVKMDAQGCPVRTMVGVADLAAALGVR